MHNGRIAIVTGASRSRGIGAAICYELSQLNMNVFFTYWEAHDKSLYGKEAQGYRELLSKLRKTGIRCECMEVDLSRPESAKQIMDTVEKRLGPPSILVNNAAHDDTDAPFDQLTAELLDTYYAVNMRGTMLLSVEFARRFSKPMGKGGRIINLTSGQSLTAMPGKLPYIATKGAIEAFTITLAAEVASRGITVNAVDPGPTDTGWMDTNPQLKQTVIQHAPFGRVGEPEDAARLVAFLASDDAEWITGQVLHSRGGF